MLLGSSTFHGHLISIMLPLMAKRTIYLSDKSFKSVHVAHSDSTGVKSGTWDVSNPLGAIFYYTNAFHLKYLLPAGDSGIICTTSTPLYLVRVRGDLVHVLDRSSSVLVLGIDPTECQFKLALQRGNSQQIEHLIANSNLVGQAIIAYLREKGTLQLLCNSSRIPAVVLIWPWSATILKLPGKLPNP